MASSNNSSLDRFFDPHHHFYDPNNNDFNKFIGQWGLKPFLPEDYKRDVIDDIASIGVQLIGSIHMEVIPDNGLDEVKWVMDLIERGKAESIKGIVASVNLADDNVDEQLKLLHDATATTKSGMLKGIRWIADYVAPYDGKNATHVATTRVKAGGVDYIRGEDAKKFEKGFALLEKYNLSFDLQCAPEQLPAAASLAANYPNIPICIDHLAKPRMILGDPCKENENLVPDENALNEWREGLKAMAQLPHVYIKISMLGFAVPGWSVIPERENVVRSLVRDTVNMFGASRCMVATNWHTSAAFSNADGLDEHGPRASEFLSKVSSFVDDFSDEEKDFLFHGTAKKFYKCE